MSYRQAELATELLLELLTGWCPVAAPWLKSDMVDVRLPRGGEPGPAQVLQARGAALAAAAAQLAAHCHRSPVAMELAERHLVDALRVKPRRHRNEQGDAGREALD